MTLWLYQMSRDIWPPERYREEVWERELVSWPTGNIAGESKPSGGDSIFLWYTKTGRKEPGLYGWGVVVSYIPDEDRLRWRPTFPSDYLKMNPLFNDEVVAVVDKIRRGMPRGTMWQLEVEDAAELRGLIQTWLSTPG